MPYYKKRTNKRKPKAKPSGTLAKASSSMYRKQNRGFKGGLFRMSVRADPFPATKYCRLVYGGVYTLTVGSTGFVGTEQVFRLNSIHDPDVISGVNHQPYGHDELATIYKQYKVYGCKVDIIFSDPSSDSVACLVRVVPPNVSASMAGAYPSIEAESPMTVMKTVNNTGSQKVRISQYIPMSRAIGITPLQFKVSTGSPYSAVFGTNPVDSPTLRIGAASNRSEASVTITAQVRLTYYTQCYERHRLTTS